MDDEYMAIYLVRERLREARADAARWAMLSRLREDRPERPRWAGGASRWAGHLGRWWRAVAPVRIEDAPRP